MAKYRVLQRSFIDNKLVEEGAVVEYDGIPASNLEPIDAAAKKAAEKAGLAVVESAVRQKAAALGGDPDSAELATKLDAVATQAATALA